MRAAAPRAVEASAPCGIEIVGRSAGGRRTPGRQTGMTVAVDRRVSAVVEAGVEGVLVESLDTLQREQAASEYRKFLSVFEGSTTKLPQVTQARAALKRLEAP